ncbi:MAG TPA: M28 family peptidase [Blastocatellia bacterium]|nr:M28 family peptidase [Blastocatellia bacterium]
MTHKTRALRFVAPFLAIAAAGSLLAFAGGLSTSILPSLVAERTSGDVSAERIAKHVSFLASDKLEGRRAGTSGAEQAAQYIAAEFKRNGLAPASSNGFLEPFSFVAEVQAGKANTFLMKRAGGATALKVGDGFLPMAFSSPGPASGPVVFAGYGISSPELQYDNYAGIDVAGKIVLVLRGTPDGDNPHGRFADRFPQGREVEDKTLKAREKRARGVVFIAEQDDFRSSRTTKLRYDLNFLDASIPAVTIGRNAAREIFAAGGTSLDEAEKQVKDKSTASELKGITIEFKTDVIKISKDTSNVVGIVRGTDPKLSSEYVVIGAHYDHLGLGGPESLAQNPEGQIHHGADDNASGTSAILELARVFAENRSRLKRSVVFCAFSGEELGLLGSGAYTRKPPVPLESTVAMINLDMVGRLKNGALVIGGAGTSPVWKQLLQKLTAPESAASSSGSGASRQLKISFQEDGYGPSDHQSFYVKNVPVLFFFTGSHEDYHKPSDTADKINADGVRQIAELARDVAMWVANENERIAFTQVKIESRPTGRGFRVYLGTVPNYSDQADGLKLDGVRAGSPAEKAGLRAGDVIIKIAGMAVKNVYDYTYALGEMRAGEEVAVVVRRDGGEVTLKLIPEKRQ